ncbi:hypothetical protein I317_03275 [Kwoniella heveanensis CBS 569]|uniref:Uncharacterized protein n=1 Tax=Kwoniella heveanensis BCC8398 TaxID=1296120 RepID=A0A1B9H0U7_9TREE|nr:hypothetical protein I316_01477 [Kwoniella heveanensis BCC8398]OCF42924.1 hypothetical protein I317_03275 [Kwoniella heveanensis CBS 569]
MKEPTADQVATSPNDSGPNITPTAVPSADSVQAVLRAEYDSWDHDMRVCSHVLMGILAVYNYMSLMNTGHLHPQPCDLTLVPHIVIALVAVQSYIELEIVTTGRERDLPATANSGPTLRITLGACMAVSAMATARFLILSVRAGGLCVP